MLGAMRLNMPQFIATSPARLGHRVVYINCGLRWSDGVVIGLLRNLDLRHEMHNVKNLTNHVVFDPKCMDFLLR